MNFRRSKFLVNVSLLGMALLFQLLPAVSSQAISCRQAMLKLLPSEVSRQLIFQDELLNKYTQKGFVFNGKSFDSVYSNFIFKLEEDFTKLQDSDSKTLYINWLWLLNARFNDTQIRWLQSRIDKGDHNSPLLKRMIQNRSPEKIK